MKGMRKVAFAMARAAVRRWMLLVALTVLAPMVLGAVLAHLARRRLDARRRDQAPPMAAATSPVPPLSGLAPSAT